MGAVLECDVEGCTEFLRGYGRLGGMGLRRKAKEAGWEIYPGRDWERGVDLCPMHKLTYDIVVSFTEKIDYPANSILD